MRARVLSAVTVALLVPGGAAAQTEPIELSHLYGPEALAFSPELPRVRWMPGGTHYLTGNGEGAERSWDVVEAATGASRPLYDADALAAALTETLALPEDEAARAARPASLTMSSGGERLLLNLASDFFGWETAENELRRLTRGPEAEELPRFSPDGRRVAFIRENDLHVTDLEGGELQLTTGGGPDLLNGKLDWVYQEEIYGRGNFYAHWWSPDGSRIAFLQSDERDVPRFTVVDHIPYHLDLEVYPYPKAGDPNPKVRLGVVPASGGETVWVNPGGYGNAERLIVNVAFSPGGDLWYQVQDRTQTFLDLHRADARTGESGRVLREDTGPWVNGHGPPRFLSDGGFLWFSERTGFKHVYRYDAEGALAGPLTEGRYEVRRLHAVDEGAGAAYASGTYRTSLGSDILRVALDGSGVTLLSEAPGTHQANFPDGESVPHYVAVSHDLDSPPAMTLRRAADGTVLRELGGGEAPDLGRFEISPPELFRIPTADGTELEAMIVRPHGFDPARAYPAWVHVYGGPHAP